jgi:hypothetical protein
LQVKREEQEKAPACSWASVQQPGGTTGSCGQSQTGFAPGPLRVRALLRCVSSCQPRRLARLRASFFCLGAGSSIPYVIAIIPTGEDEWLVNTELGRLAHHSARRIAMWHHNILCRLLLIGVDYQPFPAP